MQKLDSRLRTALKYLRKDRTLLDIGTDHAYLPIYAVENGFSSGAIASDINEGPTERARKNVAECGLSEKIKVIRADGLCGLDAYVQGEVDIAIFGMGGELIAHILDASPWIKKIGNRFILQPMTAADDLRKYLAKNGFSIIEETLSEQSGKLYVTLCCEYTGKAEEISEAEALLGKYNIENNSESPIFKKMLARTVKGLEIRINGLQSAAKDASFEQTVLSAIQTYEVKNENH